MRSGNNKIRLRYKITGLFLIIFSVSSIIGFWGIGKFLFINREFSKVTEETLPVIKTIEDLRFAALRIVSSSNEFAFIRAEKKAGGQAEEAPEVRERALIASAKGLFLQAMKKYEDSVNKSFPEAMAQLEKLRPAAQNLILTSDRLLNEQITGAGGENVLELKERFEEAETTFLTLLQDILQRQMAQLESRKQNVSAILHDALNAFIVACTLVFVFIVASGLFLSRFIVIPITRLRDAAVKIGEGNMDIRIDTKTNDEIGELASSFNEMTRNLRISRDEAMLSRKSFQEQSEFLTHVVNSIPYPFFVVNITDFTVKMVNASASSFKEWDSMKCFEMAEKMDIPCVGNEHTCSLELVRLTKKPFVTECLHHNKNNEPRYYEIHAYPVFDDKGDISEIIEYSIDITENKRAEIELQKSSDKLRLSNSELRNFLFIASHDLREPLRKVMVFGDRLRVKYSEVIDEQGRIYIEKMISATRRMHALIDSLHTYTRITTEARPFVPVNLADSVQQALDDMKEYISQTEASIEVKGMPTIEADPGQMSQLFHNLIHNALKFRKNGERPLVKIHGSIKRNGDAPDAPGADAYQIAVEDNGIGFDNKYADRIFGVFQSLHGKNEYEGTGIGLSICKKIVERHGGSIGAKSSPGEGTTFIVTLPTRQSG